MLARSLSGSIICTSESLSSESSCELSDTSATKVTLPFVEEQLERARSLMGADFWSYGVAANARTLETFLDHHHRQGLSPRRLGVVAPRGRGRRIQYHVAEPDGFDGFAVLQSSPGLDCLRHRHQ